MRMRLHLAFAHFAHLEMRAIRCRSGPVHESEYIVFARFEYDYKIQLYINRRSTKWKNESES